MTDNKRTEHITLSFYSAAHLADWLVNRFNPVQENIISVRTQDNNTYVTVERQRDLTTQDIIDDIRQAVLEDQTSTHDMLIDLMEKYGIPSWANASMNIIELVKLVQELEQRKHQS